jgi:hypothetical protein
VQFFFVGRERQTVPNTNQSEGCVADRLVPQVGNKES